MDEDLGDLKLAVDEMRRELSCLRDRLDRLEAGAGARPDGLPAIAPAAAETGPSRLAPRLEETPSGVLPLIGRFLMVLGGAYLLRALTDAHLVPEVWGTIAGLAYAVAWLVLADRAGAAGHTLSAAFHGVAALVIVHPLLWEATARFGLLSSRVCAVLLLTFLALGLFVGGRRGIAAIATASVVLAAATALGLLIRTHDLVTFAFLLLLMAVIVEASSGERWLGLRFVVALAVDLAMVVVVLVDRREGGPPEGYPPLSPTDPVILGLGLAFVYLLGVAVRACARRRPVGAFEIGQTGLALLLGYGGAASAIAVHGGSLVPLGALGLGLGAVGYLTAFAFLERRVARARNFYAFTTFGCVMTFVGARIALGGTSHVVALCVLGGAAVILGAAFGRTTLEVHGALFFLAAGLASGLFAHAGQGWLGAPSADPWPPLGPGGAAALLTGAFSYAALTRSRGHATASIGRRVPAALVAAALVWSLCGAGLVPAARLVGAPGPAADAAALAVLRTGVLALAAALLAYTSRRAPLHELAWLVYPLLGLGALKLLAEDLPRGRPATLFLAFALFGAALIAVPRLLREERA